MEQTNIQTESGERGRALGAAALYFGIFLAGQFLVSFVYTAIVFAGTILELGLGDWQALLSTAYDSIRNGALLLSAITNAVLLTTYFLIFKIRKKSVLAEARMHPVPFSRLAYLIPLGIALNVFLTGALNLLPQTVLDDYAAATDNLLNGSGLLMLAAVVFLAPLTEEVVFRGLIYTRLKRAVPRWIAVLLSSLLFGLMHGQILWIVYAGCIGALLCVVSDWYDSLWASVVLHMAFNLGSGFAAIAEAVSPVLLLPLTAALCAALLFYIRRFLVPQRQN